MRVLAADSRLRRWWQGAALPERGTVVLGHRRVYIVPTRAGWVFAGTLGILLVGSINYALQLGFALTFLLAGMGLAGMVHTTRNLARLAVSAGRAEPVFAGERAQFRVHLDSRAPFDRPAILVRHLASGAQEVLDLPAAAAGEAVLPVPAAVGMTATVGDLVWGKDPEAVRKINEQRLREIGVTDAVARQLFHSSVFTLTTSCGRRSMSIAVPGPLPSTIAKSMSRFGAGRPVIGSLDPCTTCTPRPSLKSESWVAGPNERMPRSVAVFPPATSPIESACGRPVDVSESTSMPVPSWLISTRTPRPACSILFRTS